MSPELGFVLCVVGAAANVVFMVSVSFSPLNLFAAIVCGAIALWHLRQA